MKRTISSPFFHLSLFFLSLTLLCQSNVLRADVGADRSTSQVFLKQIDKQRTTDPAGAAQAAQQFLQQHPSMYPRYLALVDVELATIYYSNLKDPDKALAALDAGIAHTTEQGAYLSLVAQKCRFLALANRPAEGLALFKQNMPKFLEADSQYFKTALPFYLLLAKAGGKPGDVTSTIFQALAVHPFIINDSKIGNALVQNLLLQSGHEEEALEYAKLHWLTCDFAEKDISDATASLQNAWIARDANPVQGAAFLKAQQDATAPNPLAQVKLPAQDAAVIQTSLNSLPPSSSLGNMHDRITLLLLQGQYGDAMLTARRLLLDNSADASQPVLEIARVFKATDLNMVRANAFLQYFKTGQGANPLDDFFKEHPFTTVAAPTH